MLKSIFLKEYWKIRRPWLALLLGNVALMAYVYIDTRQLFLLSNPEIVWYRALHIGQIHYACFKYVPTLIGILIACIQFLPEMRDERLRLSLHLPVSPHRLILAHILVGLIAGGVLILFDLATLCMITNIFYPKEVVGITLLTALPWTLAGVAAYLGGALALLEPGVKLRIFCVGIASGVVGLFLFPAAPGAYSHSLLLLVVPLLLMVPAVLLPAYHYRYRRVS